MALERVAGLLRPDGVLRLHDLVFAFEPRDAEKFVGAWLDTAADRAEDGWTREEYEAHLRDEHSTFSWLLEPIIERAGFEIERAEYRENRVYADYTCRRRSRGASS